MENEDTPTPSEDQSPSPEIKLIELGGSSMPAGLKAALAQALIGSKLKEIMGDTESQMPIPLDESEAILFFLGEDVRWSPRLGDVVVLRPEFACMCHLESLKQEAVVTQVFDRPRHNPDLLKADGAVRYNMALAFKEKHGPDHWHYVEKAFDSRWFRCVRNLFDDKSTSSE